MLPGPQKGECPDGCGLYGTLTNNGHVRGCKGPPGEPCRKCIGRRNRKKGTRKQRAAQRALGLVGPGSTLGANHEEHWRGNVRVEVKAGVQTHPAVTAYRKMRAQSEASRPIGDNRPFMGVAMPDGEPDGVVLIRLSELEAVALAIVDGLGSNGME